MGLMFHVASLCRLLVYHSAVRRSFALGAQKYHYYVCGLYLGPIGMNCPGGLGHLLYILNSQSCIVNDLVVHPYTHLKTKVIHL